MTSSFVSPRSSRFIASGVASRSEWEAAATARQEIVPGVVQAKLISSTIALIGAGGIGSEVGLALARKGVGAMAIFDHDIVELSNLNRQRFFEGDLYQNKAECLARNLTKEAIVRCRISAFFMQIQDAIEAGLQIEANVVVCGVDNNEARVAVSRHFLKTTPVVFVAVSEDADHGYVFVQEPGKACYGCLFPHSVADVSLHPCSPAIIDILKVVAGIATYAVDTLIMSRKRNWNYKEVFLSGSVPERNTTIDRKADCPICGLGETDG